MNKNQFIDWLISLNNLSRPLYVSQAQEVAEFLYSRTKEQVIEEADKASVALYKRHIQEGWEIPDMEETTRAVVSHLIDVGIIPVQHQDTPMDKALKAVEDLILGAVK